ncbi:MAG: hypothetical protein PHE83_17465 [Opitutaceae bacterium]|nr:hypothetical protein [Opitutaceae bacterium]
MRLPLKSQAEPEAAYETWLAQGLLMIRAAVFARIEHHAGKRRKVFDLPDEAPRCSI